MPIKENLNEIQTRIDAACKKANRNPNDVRLIAVTKTFPAEAINEALSVGVIDIGENRVQEAEEKFPDLVTNNKVCKHLIGHLQSNKVRKAVELFDWIHSIDSIKLAERVNRVAGELGKHPVVLIQVDLGKEPTKNGIDESELNDLAAYLATAQYLDFRGLMMIPPFFEDPNATLPYFSRLRELLRELNSQKICLKALSELSMGMSQDFEVAIQAGATLIRVGTAIFGTRSKPIVTL
ncbi:MAG: YggS family pyridoxal phosphate-dependent enzyme [Acidobacteria bacterium]|nr:YggS family pyridoxal phosphate-dependent enzyme [Acidobacteriota bacterium]